MSLLEKTINQDEHWMREALKEAQKGLRKKEVPVGAVVVYQNKIIGRGHNQTETLKDATAHAEILAIGAASNFLNSWRLTDASLYVTVEPCIMCAGAIILARVDKLLFGTFDPKAGACGSLYNLPQDIRLNHQVKIISGILEDQCKNIMKAFFEKLRKSEGFIEDEKTYEKI
jgi:tRNA(adenine34) deaminase